MWDERYAEPGFAYGTAANDFLRSVIRDTTLTAQNALCLAEGEGRNGVYLAQLGYQVDAVDSSAVGLAKAQQLASQHKVNIQTRCLNLAQLKIAPQSCDLIVSIFAHTPKEVRLNLHAQIPAALKPGGLFILEAYRAEQLNIGTGGPKNPDMLMALEELKASCKDLNILLLQNAMRDIQEGKYHTGVGAVVQLIAQKPR